MLLGYKWFTFLRVPVVRLTSFSFRRCGYLVRVGTYWETDLVHGDFAGADTVSRYLAIKR
jgi:hypothetical protein